jgi:hypothetical protein
VPVIVAAAKEEWDRGGEREAEDREQHDQSNGQRDRLAFGEIAAEDRVEVVLNRGLTRDIRVDPRRRDERFTNPVGVPLRLGEIQRRQDAAVDHVAPRLA